MRQGISWDRAGIFPLPCRQGRVWGWGQVPFWEFHRAEQPGVKTMPPPAPTSPSAAWAWASFLTNLSLSSCSWSPGIHFFWSPNRKMDTFFSVSFSFVLPTLETPRICHGAPSFLSPLPVRGLRSEGPPPPSPDAAPSCFAVRLPSGSIRGGWAGSALAVVPALCSSILLFLTGLCSG